MFSRLLLSFAIIANPLASNWLGFISKSSHVISCNPKFLNRVTSRVTSFSLANRPHTLPITPTFPLLLHYYSKIAGGSNLALRLPSIAAVLFAGFCSFILFRRHLGNASAVFGTCLILEALRSWGGLVRPYAIEAACFAAALVLWDDMNRRSAWWRSALIGLFLALATSLHFYAVLFVPCFGLIELIYILRTHKFRLSLRISLIASGASIFRLCAGI